MVIKLLKYFGFVVFLFIIDQSTKIWALENLNYGYPVSVMPGVNLTLLYNKGVSFGLFGAGTVLYRYVILALGFIITASLVYWLWLVMKQERSSDIQGNIKEAGNNIKIKLIALLLILGGAFGNLYDRFFRGFVVDFVDLYIGDWHWYFFNVADVYICIGAILLFIEIYREDKKSKNKNIRGNI